MFLYYFFNYACLTIFFIVGCICGENKLEAALEKWKELVSPDYPYVYCNELNCNYLISAPIGERILLNITQFETEANQDYLYIFNGNSSKVRHTEQYVYLSKISLKDNKILKIFRHRNFR